MFGYEWKEKYYDLKIQMKKDREMFEKHLLDKNREIEVARKECDALGVKLRASEKKNREQAAADVVLAAVRVIAQLVNHGEQNKDQTEFLQRQYAAAQAQYSAAYGPMPQGYLGAAAGYTGLAKAIGL